MSRKPIASGAVRPQTAASNAFRAALLASVAIGSIAGAAQAQQAEPGARVDTIVVTAQSREQNLQDVPISITAFDAAEIEAARIEQLDDYALATPNIQATSFGNRSRSFLTIRGVTSFGGAVPYGIYVDGLNVVPGQLTRGLDQDLQDIERIEVLRGPQGTYFGRNTMAGAINITSRSPDPEAAYGEVTADISSFDTYYARGLANLPLSDAVAIRAIAYGETTDGYIDNIGAGPGNSGESYGGRLSLGAQFTPQLAGDFSLSASRNESDFLNVVPNGVLNPQVAAAAAPLNPALTFFGLPTWPVNGPEGVFPANRDTHNTDLGVVSDKENLIASARLDYEGDGFLLTSVTGYVSTSYDEFGEEDFTPISFLTNREDNEISTFSQELRVETTLSATVDLIAGVYYAQDDTDNESERRSVPGHIYTSFVPNALVESARRSTRDVESAALFAEAIFVPNDSWEIRLGGRFTNDEVEASSLNLLAPGAAMIERSASFDAFTPRAVATWYPSEDVTLYGSVSSGYKVGGFNFTTNPAVPETYDEESAVNYEAGAKLTFMDGRFRLNTAAFYFDWTDVQVQGFDLGSGASFIQNAGEAHTQGIEVELAASPTDALELTAGIGWLEAEFDEFQNAVNSNTGQVVADASGTDIPSSPEWTLSASATYRFGLTEAADGFVRVDGRYVSDHFFDPLNDNPVDSYGLVNLRVGAEFDTFTLTAYADNVFDEDYFVGYKQGIHISGSQIVVGEPVRYGLRLRKRFE